MRLHAGYWGHSDPVGRVQREGRERDGQGSQLGLVVDRAGRSRRHIAVEVGDRHIVGEGRHRDHVVGRESVRSHLEGKGSEGPEEGMGSPVEEGRGSRSPAGAGRRTLVEGGSRLADRRDRRRSSRWQT